MGSNSRESGSFVLPLVIAFASGSCAIINAFDDEGAAITYPPTGQYGLNLLDLDRVDEGISAPAFASLRAELENDATLSVALTLLAGEAPWAVMQNNSAGWSVGIINDATLTQNFTALENFDVADIQVYFNVGTESTVRVEYFENSDVTPTYTKDMTIRHPQ